MALLAIPTTLPMAAVRGIRTWPVAYQQKSRRNAMLACTSLTQRRMERREVEDFLGSLHTPSEAPPAPRAVAHG